MWVILSYWPSYVELVTQVREEERDCGGVAAGKASETTVDAFQRL